MPVKKKVSQDVASFVGEGVQKTTLFITEQGLNLVENASLFILQRAAKSSRLKGFVHSRTPEIFHLFNNVRKSSPLLPFIAGRMAKKSTYIGLKLGSNALNFTRSVLNRIGKNVK